MEAIKKEESEYNKNNEASVDIGANLDMKL